MDKRFEGVFGQLDKRLDQLDKRLDQLGNHLESELRDLRLDLRDLRKDLNYRFYWLLGVQMSMWITIIIAILLK